MQLLSPKGLHAYDCHICFISVKLALCAMTRSLNKLSIALIKKLIFVIERLVVKLDVGNSFTYLLYLPCLAQLISITSLMSPVTSKSQGFILAICISTEHFRLL